MKEYEQRKKVDLPLSDNSFVILMMLQNEAEYPYNIKKKIAYFFNDEIEIPLQTIYSTIKSSLEKGLIESVESDENVKYKITEKGIKKINEKYSISKLIFEKFETMR